MKIIQGIPVQIIVQMNSTLSLNIIKETVGIVNRFINKVMIIKMMGKGIIIVKVKADMVLMEVNSLPVGIINKTNIIKTGNREEICPHINKRSQQDQFKEKTTLKLDEK
jgi:hypothetical protein